jgi:hypothetical protein
MFNLKDGERSDKGKGGVTLQNGSHDIILEISLSQRTTWSFEAGKVGDKEMSS